jgi:hypothetical protein
VAQDDSKKAAPRRKRAAVADREATEYLRKADPVLGRLIDAQPALPKLLRRRDAVLARRMAGARRDAGG